MKVCYKSKSMDIDLIQTGRNRFTVRYGLQVKKDLTYSMAAKELGSCIMHAAACEGKLSSEKAT